jgi:hypothetical protein
MRERKRRLPPNRSVPVPHTEEQYVPGARFDPRAQVLTPRGVMYLQRTIGNQAVQRTLTGRPSTDVHSPSVLTASPYQIQQAPAPGKTRSQKPNLSLGSPIKNATESFYDINERDLGKVASHFKFPSRVGKVAGKASWTLTWGSYTPTGKRGAGVVDPIPWTFTVTVQLPRWKNFAKAPAKDKAEWARYMRALRNHEQGHVDRALKEFKKAKWRRATGRTTRAIERKIKGMYKAMLAKMEADSKAYDKKTDHGKKQKPKAWLDPPGRKKAAKSKP